MSLDAACHNGLVDRSLVEWLAVHFRERTHRFIFCAEGFASWVEYLAVDYLFPAWKMWTQFISQVQIGRPFTHLFVRSDQMYRICAVHLPLTPC